MPEDQAVTVFVNGTLMRGEELHGNLRGARFIGGRRTAPRYRLYSVADRHPAMQETDEDGVSVAGELYCVPLAVLARVLRDEPPGLGLGVVRLDDGSHTLGVVRVAGGGRLEVRDISEFGGWREYRRTAMAASDASDDLQRAGYGAASNDSRRRHEIR